jgi:hypothetical protein
MMKASSELRQSLVCVFHIAGYYMGPLPRFQIEMEVKFIRNCPSLLVAE